MKKLFCNTIILVTISVLSACSAYQTRDDLPEYKRINSKESTIPVFWRWKTRPTQKDRYWIFNLLVDEDFLKKNGKDKGEIVGVHSTIDKGKTINYLIVQFSNGEYYFVSENDWKLYKIFKDYFVPDSEAAKLKNGQFIFANQVPLGTRIEGMICTNAFDSGYAYDLFSGRTRFDTDVILPSGGAIFVGRCPKFEEARKYMKKKFPVYDLRICGEYIGQKALTTRSGFLRNFNVYQIKYILYYWGDKVVALPGE